MTPDIHQNVEEEIKSISEFKDHSIMVQVFKKFDQKQVAFAFFKFKQAIEHLKV